ncbi:MAG: TolC family protein [Sphingobacterium sp.]|jgi:outer membrane protein TolC|nr:TolC family protein [Sphingobacterium sp.]
MKLKLIAALSAIWGISLNGFPQTLKLEDAITRAVEQYDQIKSKQFVAAAARQHTFFQKQQYLPDLTIAAQQSFGTINAQHGPMYAYGGLASGATSMPLAEQNWNAAFGSLYFANINWNLYTFGRIKNQVLLGSMKEQTTEADLTQEVFQHKIKTSATYLNLLASQRIKYVQEKNLNRAQVFYEMTAARAESGLIADVDAQLAKAEVSNAKSLQIKSYDKELEYSKQLALLLNDDFKTYQLDTVYNTSIPNSLATQHVNLIEQHPFLLLQNSKINESIQTEEVLKSNRLPSVSAFGVIQGRGTGFDWNYIQDNTAYSTNYLKGIGVNRANYLLGFSLNWNLTNIFRFDTKTKEQKLYTQAVQIEYEKYKKDFLAQSLLADSQLKNAIDNFEETRIQLSAARLAYKQHHALYENGLTTLVDYTQALYSLNRAEIDYEIAQNNVWQALLLLAAAQGDFNIFIHHS